MPLRRRALLLCVLAVGAPIPVSAQADPPPSAYEARLDSILYALERPGHTAAALEAYRAVERDLLQRELAPSDPGYPAQQRTLAYVLLRQGNMLRQLGREAEALQVAERELAAARASGDPLTEARTEFSFGATLLANRQTARGMVHLERARELFAGREEPDFRQGLGWYWIIRADLARAGLVAATPEEMIGFADAALEVLMPVENWAGVARAHAARAYAREQLGQREAAAADREAETRYTALADQQPEP
ncbi:MAG TPA: hypothetical protein VHG93_07660 [Longimicrobium sp.]|nr:hypothetical protein [Longimicrobium sp.]